MRNMRRSPRGKRDAPRGRRSHGRVTAATHSRVAAVRVLIAVALGAGGLPAFSDGDGGGAAVPPQEWEIAPPSNVAEALCWDAHGQVDLGRTVNVYQVELALADSVANTSAAEVSLLDEHGRLALPCRFQRGDGRQAQYACNGAGRWVRASHPAHLEPCAVSVWGESVLRASEARSHVEELYTMANTKWPGCTECKRPLATFQTCARISRVRAAGGDGHFARFLAACTNDAGAIWLRRGEHVKALQMFRRALPLIPDHPIVILNIAAVSRKLCEWSDWHKECQLMQETVDVFNRRGRALLNPYMVETYGLSPASILDMVSIISLHTFDEVHTSAATPIDRLVPSLPRLHVLAPRSPRSEASRLRVGYYSLTGLNAGRLSIGRFLQSVIALHGSEDGAPLLDAFCYGQAENDDGSAIYRTLSQGCAGRRVLDTEPLSFADKARRIRGDELDIFVDLSGYTHAASFTPVSERDGVLFRSDVHRLMALGMAPLHVSWWGYTGTLGAEYVHYVATDVQATPPEMRGYYSEKVVYLPGTTYLVSDHIISRQEVLLQHPDARVDRHDRPDPAAAQQRSASVVVPSLVRPVLPARVPGRMACDPASRPPSKQQVLEASSEVSVVLCSFNQFYKLNPDIWRLWMQVLKRTGNNSVLWMLEFDGDAVNNLVEEAVMAGVSAWRIIVTSLLPHDREFLSKGVCDLYLDTPLFNAHTTAKDALWSGVPVLAVAGEGMASRVAASLSLLLDPAGVTIARNLEDYLELAVRIASNTSTLAHLKRKVRGLRWTAPVFDTLGWMARWQRQLRNMADLVAAGYFPPAHMHLVGGSTRDA